MYSSCWNSQVNWSIGLFCQFLFLWTIPRLYNRWKEPRKGNLQLYQIPSFENFTKLTFNSIRELTLKKTIEKYREIMLTNRVWPLRNVFHALQPISMSKLRTCYREPWIKLFANYIPHSSTYASYNLQIAENNVIYLVLFCFVLFSA